MKIIHVLIGLFYSIYAGINFSNLGIGEWLSIAVSCSGLAVCWRIFKKDLTGMYLSGILMGCMVEYITEAYWHYDRFKVFICPDRTVPIWGDISLFVILGWGYSFSMFVLFSNWLFKKITGLPITDGRIIIFDAILSPLWFVPYELLGINALGLWKYTDCSHWTTNIPIINYPVEGVIGAMLFGMVLPSFVRHWGDALKATRKRRI